MPFFLKVIIVFGFLLSLVIYRLLYYDVVIDGELESIYFWFFDEGVFTLLFLVSWLISSILFLKKKKIAKYLLFASMIFGCISNALNDISYANGLNTITSRPYDELIGFSVVGIFIALFIFWYLFRKKYVVDYLANNENGVAI